MNMMSDTVNELFSALAKAQGLIQNALKDSQNPFFKSSYANLASVWEACRKPLSDNGLSVSQTTCKTEHGLFLITILGHSSGQWMRSEMPIILVKNDPQSLGSMLTYLRRYSLSAIVGVAPDDDDDGEKAQQAFRKNPPSLVPVLTAEQMEQMNDIMTSVPPEYTERLKDFLDKWCKANTKTTTEMLAHFSDLELLKNEFREWVKKK